MSAVGTGNDFICCDDLADHLHHNLADPGADHVGLLLGCSLAVHPNTVLSTAGSDKAPTLGVFRHHAIDLVLEERCNEYFQS